MAATKRGPTTRHLPLHQRPSSAGLARTWMRQRLDEWDMQVLEDDCLLVTSELVTNALRYGLAPILLTLVLGDDELTVEVTDAGHGMQPEAVASGMADPERGRGLAIVEACTDRVRVAQREDDGQSVLAAWRRPGHDSRAATRHA